MSRVIQIQAAPQPVVSLDRLTITGGSGQGGGVSNNTGLLTMTNCLVTGNTSMSDSPGVFVPIAGELFMENCTVSGNFAPFGMAINAGSGTTVSLTTLQTRPFLALAWARLAPTPF
jgi:hypothetical protein